MRCNVGGVVASAAAATVWWFSLSPQEGPVKSRRTERWLDRKANRLDDKLCVHLSHSTTRVLSMRREWEVFMIKYGRRTPTRPGTWSQGISLSDAGLVSGHTLNRRPPCCQAQLRSNQNIYIDWRSFEWDSILQTWVLSLLRSNWNSLNLRLVEKKLCLKLYAFVNLDELNSWTDLENSHNKYDTDMMFWYLCLL